MKRHNLQDLYRLHAEMFETTIKDSRQIVDSVLAAITEEMRRTDILHLADFGKFQLKVRKGYTVQNNLPHAENMAVRIPSKYVVKFSPLGALNAAAADARDTLI